MTDREKCSSPASPTSPESFKPILDPDVCVFRHVALLHLPEPFRGAMLHLGILLFAWSMETWGIADEVPDTEAQTRKRLEAIARDLRTEGEQLGALGLEGEDSVIRREEQRMCDAAGELAPEVLALAGKVRRVAGV